MDITIAFLGKFAICLIGRTIGKIANIKNCIFYGDIHISLGVLDKKKQKPDNLAAFV